MYRKILYRSLTTAVIVILAVFAVAVPHSAAQGRPQLKRPNDEQPLDKPPEPKKKKVKGPRAVAVLQLQGSKGTLIPVAILVEGKFYDASAYKADPVPMAIEAGTVYEAEQAGESLGLFTINAALHSKRADSPHPWTGAGWFLPAGAEAPKTTRKAEDVPVGMDKSDSDAPPRLTRGNAAKPAASPSATPAAGSPGSTAPTSTASASTAPASTAPAATASSDQSPTTAPSTQAQPATGPSGSGSSGQDAPKTTPPTAAGSTTPTPLSSTASAPAGPGQTSENYYRPTLRRGKPTEPAPQEDELTTKVGNLPASGTAAPGTAPSANLATAQLIAAISDDGGPYPRSYKFFFKTGEEDDRRQQILALAAEEVRAYANALERNRIPAAPSPAKASAARHKAPAQPAQLVFENAQFHAFDVWGNTQPVMIFTAEAHFPPTPASPTAPETYYITLVARTDIYGNLLKVYSGVTDKLHLDVTPRLELIDAVDADGDGRGELLFRETTDAGSGYVIYRATADKLWKMFDSLNAE
jgi:hypothetical protein